MYCKEMFLSILIFPTLFLQANVLITLKLEKLDMVCNIVSLILNVGFCLIGFTFSKSLTVVNLAIFFSFIAFHAIQDVVLWRKKVSGIGEILLYYIGSAAVVLLFQYLADRWHKEILFFLFWLVLAIIGGTYYLLTQKKKARTIAERAPQSNG
jgi:hypothetical protein